MKYQYNVTHLDENGKMHVEWDAQDPESTKKDLIAAGIEPSTISIIENFGQAHYRDKGVFYDGYVYEGTPVLGNLQWKHQDEPEVITTPYLEQLANSLSGGW